MRGLDAWILSPRYSKEQFVVECPQCQTETPVTSETEYGMTEWSPAECPKCGREFNGGEPTRDDEPDWDVIRDEREWEANQPH